MLHLAITLREPGSDFFRIVFERAVAALVGDAAHLVNHIKALRPGRIGVIGGIAHLVDAERNREVIPRREIVRNGYALCDRLRLRVANVVRILQIRLHLPFVRRMRLAHVNRQKVRVILVIVVDANDVANLATKGRSSKASKNQDEWLARRAFPNVKTRLAI
jgi:hypothetical protein